MMVKLNVAQIFSANYIDQHEAYIGYELASVVFGICG